MSRSSVLRLALVPSLALGILAVTPHAASATTVADCNGSSVLTSVSYQVDGQNVLQLRGSTAGAVNVKATFTVAPECDGTQLGLAVYRAPKTVFDPADLDKQILSAQSSGTFTPGSPHTLSVNIANCAYQIDFFTGPVLHNLSATNNYSYPVDNLIDADNAGNRICDVGVPTPPPVRPEPTTTTTVAPPAPTTTTTVAPPAPTTTTTTVPSATNLLPLASETTTTTLTTPVQVLGEVILPTSPAQSPQLAVTGAQENRLALLGAVLLAFGAGFTLASRRTATRP